MTNLASKLFHFVLPFALASMLSAPSIAANGPKGDTVVDVALSVNSQTGEFNTLIAAVLCEGQEDVLGYLDGNGQRTVFAPTDDAFAALGLDAGNICTALDSMVLTDILQYHVAKGRRYAEDVVSSDQIRMVFGGFLDVVVDGGVTLIDNLDREASVLIPDVEAANGIIHVIDTVVLPYDPT